MKLFHGTKVLMMAAILAIASVGSMHSAQTQTRSFSDLAFSGLAAIGAAYVAYKACSTISSWIRPKKRQYNLILVGNPPLPKDLSTGDLYTPDIDIMLAPGDTCSIEGVWSSRPEGEDSFYCGDRDRTIYSDGTPVCIFSNGKLLRIKKDTASIRVLVGKKGFPKATGSTQTLAESIMSGAYVHRRKSGFKAAKPSEAELC